MGKFCGLPTDDEVVMNMVNAVLGRLHLASDLRKLSDGQIALVREGVNYMRALVDFKKVLRSKDIGLKVAKCRGCGSRKTMIV